MVSAVTVLAAVTVTVGTGPAVSARGAASGSYLYWDQNEEQQVLTPSGHVGLLVPPYDPNGQMCIFPDRSGRFVTGWQEKS